jgi:hypothetical protein
MIHTDDDGSNDMQNHLTRLTDWLQVLRDRYRIQYQRAKLAWPDYGRGEKFEWPLVVDGLLSNLIVLLRSVSFIWGGLVALYAVVVIFFLYTIMRTFFY